MERRFELISGLNKKMVSNFKEINELIPVIYDNFATNEEKQNTFNSFEKYMYSIYDLLVEYASKTMNLEDNKFSLEWLESNISDDNSYILADEVEVDEEPIIVPIYERDSYIQEEYIQTILKLQNLVLSEAKFDELFDFYREDTKNIIGCAKMLMYHTEDLKDILILTERKTEDEDCVSLEKLKQILQDMKAN